MRDLKKEFTIPNGVNSLNATASLDPFFGPFESVNEAYNLVPENKRKVGKPFAVYLDSTKSNIKLYYWITNSAGAEWRPIPLIPDIDTDRVISLGAITVDGSVVTIGLPSGGANIVQINNTIYSRYEPISFTTDAIIVAGNFRKDIIEARADSTVFYLKKGVESTNAVPPAVTEGALFISEVLVTSTGVSAGALNSVVTDSTMKGDGTSGNPLGLSDAKNAEIAGKVGKTTDSLTSPTSGVYYVYLANSENSIFMRMNLTNYMSNFATTAALNIAATTKSLITTSTNITSDTSTDEALSQSGRVIQINNGASNINYTINKTSSSKFVTKLVKAGAGSITILAGTDVTIKLMDGTTVCDGIEGGTVVIERKIGTDTFYVYISSYE